MKPKKRPVPRSSRFNPLSLKQQPTITPRGNAGRLPVAAKERSAKKPFLQRINPFKWNWLFLFTPRKWNWRHLISPRQWHWKRNLLILGTLTFLVVVGAAAVFSYFVRDLPNPTKLVDRNLTQSTKILDRNGKTLYSFYGDKNRTYVGLDQIDPNLQHATISVEDASFYDNSGFAITGILRAVRNRITHQGLTGGGSTITQQFVKNADQEVQTTSGKAAVSFTGRTLSDKIKELILSVEVEQKYSKDDILTGYLNSISYGNSNYGVEAAAQAYFGHSAAKLSLSEAATLAAIPQLPSYYSPYGTHLEALFTRKNLVLNRMVSAGYITQAQADAAKAEAPSSANPTFATRSDLLAPQFVFFVRQQLLSWIGGDAQSAELQLDNGGYTVTTSLDLDTQNLAQGIVGDMGQQMVNKYNATNAALSAVDPNTGEVIAMVGSIDYAKSISGNTNYATAGLQPGSSFKPFVYATSFNQTNKKSPSSITYDLKTDFGGGYTPLNYNVNAFMGPVTNRVALANSLNIPAVKNLALNGVGNAIATAHAMGITTLNNPPSSYGLSLVLGAGEVRGVDMANAYGTFANGGTAHPLRPILTIKKGDSILKDFTKDDAASKAIEPEVAYEITSILSDTASRKIVFGSLANNFVLSDRPAAAKSGTTQNNRDGWTVGYTPQLSVAVWVGNNLPNQVMKVGADGSVVAAPIWKKFLTEWSKGKPVVQFTQPDTIKTLTVDKLSGKLPTDQTPEADKITDIFAPWQIPTDFDDVHTLVNIDSATGKLATALTPAANIVPTYFFQVHSEMPNNPNWEGPVQAWAAANGGGTTAPTASDDLHTTANAPTISITAPANGSTVSGTFTMTANPGGTQAITKVEFFINNVSVGSVNSAPWQMTYDASGLPSGSENIEAVATNAIGLTASASVTVTKADSSGATLGAITNLEGKLTALRTVHLLWTNPASPSLNGVNIYYSTTSGGPWTLAKSVAAAPGASASADVTVPGAGSYYFIVHATEPPKIEGPASNQVGPIVTP
jgi:membrane peptidoglycan carboxypeptidase